jgi:integrase
VASIQQKGDAYYCQFLFQGKRWTVTVGKVSYQDALAFATRTDELLGLLGRGRLTLPDGVAITDFVLADGRIETVCPPAEKTPAPPTFTLSLLRQKYEEAHQGGAMEQNSLATALMHLRHFGRTLGERFDLHGLTLPDLQKHVVERRKKKYRGRPLSPVTLRKEIASFRAAWNWAAVNGLVQGTFPAKGIVYPKADEKLPFMTFAEIERRVSVGGLSAAETGELWECLYLRKEESAGLLEYLKMLDGPAWLYPLVGTTVYTGARRSEVLRMQVGDVDFEAVTILVREKKRSRKQRTTRRVSLTPALATILKEWLAVHPGGRYLFCQSGTVQRSKKRSGTTGHKSQGNRDSSLKGRLASVRTRATQAPAPVTRDEAHDHFQRALSGSKWAVLRGFHVLRHSFISCLAAAGVDQRIIDDWTGHSTEEQRRRYRHLVPDVKQQAITGVFG